MTRYRVTRVEIEALRFARAEARMRALKVPCPQCASGEGMRCMTSTMRWLATPHKPRVQASKP